MTILESMKSLLIETANHSGAFCLIEDNKIVLTKELKAGEHAAALLPKLVKQYIKIDEIGYIFVCNGPGSFTGIRVGLSLSYGLSFLNNIIVFPLNSLQSLSFHYKFNKVVMPAVGGGFFKQNFKNDYLTPADDIEHIAISESSLAPPSMAMLAENAMALMQQSKIPRLQNPIMPLYVKPCYAKAKR